MVSNVLKLSQQDLVAVLLRFRTEYGEDPEYQALRQQFPADWPM
jgi:hypothetical protein